MDIFLNILGWILWILFAILVLVAIVIILFAFIDANEDLFEELLNSLRDKLTIKRENHD